MTNSILDSTKKILGVDAAYEAFDLDIITHINTVFATLQQLGVGPSAGYMIEDKTAEWGHFLGDDQGLNGVKTYVYLRVRLLFDPPATSFAISAIQEQIKEMEWRLQVYRDVTLPIEDPAPTPDEDEELLVLDGGDPWS